MRLNEPQTEDELLARCQTLAGKTFAQLASLLTLVIPTEVVERKGWVGQAIELALGASAGSQSKPDFVQLGVELKTIPVTASGRPAESTFVTNIPLLTIHEQTWETSQCFSKLKRVLWIPIESDSGIPFVHRRIGQPILWSPTQAQQDVLSTDWTELTTMIAMGQLNQLDATFGVYLQVRPKAANARSRCLGFDEQGCKVQTIPRGFYLRSRFTAEIISPHLSV